MTSIDPLVAPASPPAGVGWRVYSSWRGPPANRNQVVGQLADARSIRLHFDLYAPATASVVVDGRSPSAAALQELSQDLVVYRWNPYAARYNVLFRGPVGHTQDVVSETTHTVNVTAADYRAMLARRPIGGPLTYTNTDQFVIAGNVMRGAAPYVADTPPYDQGISGANLLNPDYTPLAATGVLRDRTYTGAEKTADMLDNLAQVVNGFEWGCEPLDPMTASTPGEFCAQAYVWYPRRGVTKSFVADYGATMASLSRTVDSTSFANWVRNDGAPDTAGLPVFAVAAGDVVTNPQLHAEGWWPAAITNPSTTDPDTLAEQAAGALGLQSVLMPSYSLTLLPGVWQWRDSCWLGDTIGVRVSSGRLKVDTQARIVQVDFNIADTGTETTTLTVARVVPTLADVLADQRSTLDALTRR